MNLLKRILAALAMYALVFGGISTIVAALTVLDYPERWTFLGAFWATFKVLHIAVGVIAMMVGFIVVAVLYVPKLMSFVFTGDWK